MPMFSIEKTVVAICPPCGKLMDHKKVAEDFNTHILITFFSCFLWLPVVLILAAIDKARPFRCVGCGTALTEKPREAPNA